MTRASYWTADENSAPTHPTVGKAAHRLSRQIRMNLTWHSQTQPGEPLAGRNSDRTPDQDSPGWLWAVEFDRECDLNYVPLKARQARSEEHTSELQSRLHLVC